LYLEPSEKNEKHIKTWFRKTDGWWDAVEIVSWWQYACVPFLTFLREKKLGYIKPGFWSP
jgi:hypothetical protein